MHKEICAKYNLERKKEWWAEPEKVMENKQAKILWDSPVLTDILMLTYKQTMTSWFAQIPGHINESDLQKRSALLGTAKILRRVFRLPGLW